VLNARIDYLSGSFGNSCRGLRPRRRDKLSLESRNVRDSMVFFDGIMKIVLNLFLKCVSITVMIQRLHLRDRTNK
jgi:hypothetical protein